MPTPHAPHTPPDRPDPRARPGLSERVLLALSRERSAPEDTRGGGFDGDNALELLRREFPDLGQRITGQRVLDFGSGLGYQSVALARLGARSVLGLDTNPAVLPRAREVAERAGVAERVRFADRLRADMRGTFDVIVSQNAMEHFGDPEAVLAEMERALRPGGEVLLVFGPPWYAPWGSHMQFFTRVPWVNLLFAERTVMRVRARYRDDGATRYEEVEGGLNRMTVAKFERLVARSGLVVRSRRYAGVRGLDALGRLPVVRELFVNMITCVLAKPSPRDAGRSGGRPDDVAPADAAP
jgi:SAM-dependent methyltransferase